MAEIIVNEVIAYLDQKYRIVQGGATEPIGLESKRRMAGEDGVSRRTFYGLLSKQDYNYILQQSRDSQQAARWIEDVLVNKHRVMNPRDVEIRQGVIDVLEQLGLNVTPPVKEGLPVIPPPENEPYVPAEDVEEMVDARTRNEIREKVVARLKRNPTTKLNKKGEPNENKVRAEVQKELDRLGLKHEIDTGEARFKAPQKRPAPKVEWSEIEQASKVNKELRKQGIDPKAPKIDHAETTPVLGETDELPADLSELEAPSLDFGN